MFIRKRQVTGPNGQRYTYYAIVETVRIDGKPRQKLLYNMGKRKTIAECIELERKKLGWHQPKAYVKTAATLAGVGFRMPRMPREEMCAKYQKQIDFLEDLAAKLKVVTKP
jgi:hypothetical protein